MFFIFGKFSTAGIPNGVWSGEKQVITPPVSSNSDNVGSSVAISGGYAVVGTLKFNGNLIGQAWVYERINNIWTYVATLSGNGTTFSEFG